MISRIEASLVGRPYERLYRVSMRIFSPDDPSVGFDSVSWRRDRIEAEEVFRGTHILSLMAKAGLEFGWDYARGMTAEKKMTLHVFDAQGGEIPRHEICLMEESATLKDLENLIFGGED